MMQSGRFDKEFINEEGDRVMGKRLSFLDFPSDLPRFGASKSIWYRSIKKLFKH